MVFGRMKDSALGMGLKKFVNERLGQYGEVRDVKVDTKASRITIEALLKGERDVVIATIERYELEREGDEVYVVLRSFSTSREWLTLLLARLLTGKRYKIPGAVASLL